MVVRLEIAQMIIVPHSGSRLIKAVLMFPSFWLSAIPRDYERRVFGGLKWLRLPYIQGWGWDRTSRVILDLPSFVLVICEDLELNLRSLELLRKGKCYVTDGFRFVYPRLPRPSTSHPGLVRIAGFQNKTLSKKVNQIEFIDRIGKSRGFYLY